MGFHTLGLFLRILDKPAFIYRCIIIFGLILLMMIDSTSDQKDIPWFYFISSTSLVMSITALLFRWREEPMIIFSGNFQTNNFNEIFQFLILLSLFIKSLVTSTSKYMCQVVIG
ncbi:hypothetical protein BT93_C0962 [Corymbia citriodora subsp. variegata]|nr:hypothetical protein BT93_C0962 [Corymbia citriodora subsp. variegata]